MSYPWRSDGKELLSGSMGRPCHEVGDVFRRYGGGYRTTHSLNRKQLSVMDAIERCRTSQLGYHMDECDECGHLEHSYNSCRDRHCPKCQGISRRKWVNGRLEDLLPVPYYHVVFTLPDKLFPMCLYNKRVIYELLFSSASETLLSFGRDPRWLGGEMGFFGVLHSWGQTLWHHLHAHFMVPGGALSEDGRWIEPKYKGKFLFPVVALSKVFRGKFIEGLKKAHVRGDLVFTDDMSCFADEGLFDGWCDELVSKDWVVYCKPPFSGAEHVVKYIGRYTHRVAISNSRLVSIDNGEIIFRYKDYKDKEVLWKEMALGANEFIQRFLWHVLPSGFHKIRHFGFLTNAKCKVKVARIRALLQEEGQEMITGVLEDIRGFICGVCGKGKMVPLLVIDRFGNMLSSIGDGAKPLPDACFDTLW